MKSLRSLLFAPGNQPHKIEKVFTFGADAVCLDLEDAVPVSEKQQARALVGKQLHDGQVAPFYVRINPLDSAYCFADIEAVVRPALAGLIVPMVERSTDLAIIDWLVGQYEERHGIAKGTIDVIPTIETSRGFVELASICAAPGRARRLSFGAWDFTLETGITYTRDESGIADARSRIVLHSRGAGLEAPIDASYPVLEDLEGLKRSCLRARDMGFAGKACIHPGQVATVNEAFSLSAQERSQAEAIVAEFEKAEASGSASIRVAGQFVDYPMYKKAKALLAQASAPPRSCGSNP